MEVYSLLITSLICVALVAFLGLFLRLYNELVAKPDRLRAALRKQGISGPPPRIVLGNVLDIKKAVDAVGTVETHGANLSHNCGALLFPFLDQWTKQYGKVFMFSLGNAQILYVSRPDIVKEMVTCTSLDLGRPEIEAKDFSPLFGEGISVSNGAIWRHQRKIIAPEFYMDKVKGYTNLIQESTMSLINSWRNAIESEGGIANIKIDHHLKFLSGDVLSRACFGTNYAKGEEFFSKLRALQEIVSRRGFALGIPGMRQLPSKSNREAWALEKEINALILKAVKIRNEVGSDKDLLQMILDGAAKNKDLMNRAAIDQFVIDNCKSIYLAGTESTALSAAWCLVLLAINLDWQDRVRAEAVEVCRGRIPDADMIRKLKQLTMVINETLRLYPPVAVISREALKDMKLGDIHIPKGVCIWTLITTLHTDPEIWGPDSYKFNPHRFANGINEACKIPYFYMPFGVGPRICLGQNLAMVELKILLSTILCNFSFTLAPNYVHSPRLNMVIEAGCGVDLLVKKL